MHLPLLDGSQRVERQEPLLAEVGLHHGAPEANGVEPKLLETSKANLNHNVNAQSCFVIYAYSLHIIPKNPCLVGRLG